MMDPIAVEAESLAVDRGERVNIDCPACGEYHLLSEYIEDGCPNYMDPKRPILIHYEDE